MRIHQSIYRTLFVLFLLVQIIFPSVELSVLLSFAIIFSLAIEKKIMLNTSFSNLLAILALMVLIGSLSTLMKEYEPFDILRDFLHFSKPALLMLAGYLLLRKINDVNFFFRAIVYISVVFAIKHLIVLGITEYEKGTIEELRRLAGAGNFTEAMGFVFLIIFFKQKVLNITKATKLVFISIIFVSIVFYFSRTMLFAIGILLLSVYGYTILSRKAFEYSVLGVVVAALLFGYLWTLDLKPEAKGVENFLYKIRNAPAEVFTTPTDYDPNNHKEIFDHWRAYEAHRALSQMKENQFSYVAGRGFGSLVDLGFKAPIGGEDGLRYIPHLHNGYVYVILKSGFLGLFLYLLILYSIYRMGYKKTESLHVKKINRMISGLGTYYLLSTFVIAGMYNLQEISLVILGCLYALSSKLERETQVNEIASKV